MTIAIDYSKPAKETFTSTTAIGKGDSAPRYDLIRDYQSQLKDGLTGVVDSGHISTSPSWALAIIPLGRPQSFSRDTNTSIGKVTEGAFTRREKPLIITDDCVSLSISNSKRSHTKNLQANLKHSITNYLDSDIVLPGDWILAWCWTNEEDQGRVIKQILAGGAANGPSDGLKFVGRVHGIRKSVNVNPEGGQRSVGYSMSAVEFEELDTQFFYDYALATSAATSGPISLFMAQLGLSGSELFNEEQAKAGNIKDNADKLIESLVNIVIGKGVAETVNRALERSDTRQLQVNPDVKPAGLKVSPQANKEAPFAYLVPMAVGLLMGGEKSKGGDEASKLFGYADIMDTLIGVQTFKGDEASGVIRQNNTSTTFVPDVMYPKIEPNSTVSRKHTTVKLKGTFLPVTPSFVNIPLFQMLQQFINNSINEMYTVLRANETGAVVPTLVVRQIPFSTPSAKEYPDFPLTRFLSMPRWVIHPVMVSSLDVGRSNATRTNMLHIYGEAMTSGVSDSVTNQMVRNAPVFDQTDIQRSGIRAQMKSVNCAIVDQKRKNGARVWMEAIADWTFGSQYTLNGTINSIGIQTPIAEGDNLEFEGVVYHIEALTHHCSVSPDGRKSFHTSIELSNGMPKDQSDATVDFPRYPGFRNTAVEKRDVTSFFDELVGGDKILATERTDTKGDPEIVSSQDPGATFETKL